MKERPILFSTPMVQAILEGRKTQTRRIIKVQPDFDNELLCTITDTTGDKKVIGKHFWGHPNNDWNAKEYFSNPYGQVGDVLWVRETWQKLIDNYDSVNPKFVRYLYKADNENWPGIKWKPSIFMPREACRIRREITNIRVERLQDISEQDAIDEGIEFRKDIAMWKSYLSSDTWYGNSIWSYQSLWQKINGKDSWDLNPWVFVIEFKKL